MDDTQARRRDRIQETACHHLVPRPPRWRDNLLESLLEGTLGIVTAETLQLRLNEYARELNTTFYTTTELTIGDPRMGGRKMLLEFPALVCPDCAPRLRESCDRADELAEREAPTRRFVINA
jgi:hypothetical protein